MGRKTQGMRRRQGIFSLICTPIYLLLGTCDHGDSRLIEWQTYISAPLIRRTTRQSSPKREVDLGRIPGEHQNQAQPPMISFLLRGLVGVDLEESTQSKIGCCYEYGSNQV